MLTSNFKVPGVFVTIDNSRAGASGVENFRTMVIGQKLSSGTATANVPIRVFSGSQTGLFGVGSNMAEMLRQVFVSNITGEVWAIPVEDASAGTQAVWTLTVTGPATAAGTIQLYVNDQRLQVGVTSGQTVSSILSAIQATIAAHPELPLTAGTPDSTTIAFTARHKGTIGNQVQIGFNQSRGDAFPSGVGITLASTTSGATDPATVQTAIDAIPDEIFDLIIFPWSDATNIGLFSTELANRWGNMVQLDGIAFTPTYGAAATVVSLGESLNTPYVSVFDCGADPVSAPYQFIGNIAGVSAPSIEADPALAITSLPLTGIIGDGESTRRTLAQRQSILSAGISTLVIDRGGNVTIDRAVTTYKTNAYGVIDYSYQDVSTMFSLSYLRKSFRSFMATTWARSKLADDGWSGAPGQKVAMPSTIKASVIVWLRQMESQGLIEAPTQDDLDNLSVTRDSTNRNMVHIVMSPNLMNNLLITDATIQFVL